MAAVTNRIYALARIPRSEPAGEPGEPSQLSPSQVVVGIRPPKELIRIQDRLDEAVTSFTAAKAEYRRLIGDHADREKGAGPLRTQAGVVAAREMEVRELTAARDTALAPHAEVVERALLPLLARSVRRCFWLLDQFVSELRIQAEVMTELSHVGIRRSGFPAAGRALIGAPREMQRRQIP
jgi:hypothetical protein